MSTIITFHITEVAYRCRLSAEDILFFISHDWVQPLDSEKLLFDEDDIARIILITDLRRDMGVNDEGIPIVLHLVDQLNHLHLKLSIDE